MYLSYLLLSLLTFNNITDLIPYVICTCLTFYFPYLLTLLTLYLPSQTKCDVMFVFYENKLYMKRLLLFYLIWSCCPAMRHCHLVRQSTLWGAAAMPWPAWWRCCLPDARRPPRCHHPSIGQASRRGSHDPLRRWGLHAAWGGGNGWCCAGSNKQVQ